MLATIGNGIKGFFGGMGKWILNHKKRCIFFVIILILALVGLQHFKKMNEMRQMNVAMDEGSMITTTLTKMDLNSSISVTGNLSSADARSVSATLTNIEIESIAVEVGDYVEAGDTIIIFSSEDLEEDLDDLNANATLSNLKNSKTLSDAEENLENAEETYESDQVSLQQDVNEAYAEYVEAQEAEATAKKAYASAQTATETAEAKVNTAKTALEKAKTEYTTIEVTFNTAKTAYEVAVDAAGEDGEVSESISSAYTSASAAYYSALSTYEAAQTAYNEALAAYQEAQAAETQAEAAYSAAKTATNTAYANWCGRVNDQTSTNEKNAEAIEEAQYNLEVTELEQSINKKTQTSQIQEAEEKLGQVVITSPISGTITAINYEAGDTYTGGTLFVVQDTTNFVVAATVDEYDISSISKNMKAVVKTDATDDLEISGVLTYVSPVPTSSTGSSGGIVTTSTSVEYEIQITLTDTDENLRVGMTAKTSIILDSREDVFAVAYDCVTTDDDGNSYITVVDSAGSTAQIAVEVGMESDYYVEIISDELYEGMQVVASISSSSSDTSGMGSIMEMMNSGGGGGFSGGGDMPSGGMGGF